jgi:hypothetical protein
MNKHSLRSLRFIMAAILSSAAAGAMAQADTGRAAQAFEVVRSVLQHPRCQNCHIPGDAPRQHDASLRHDINVQRGPTGNGAAAMECSSCHQAENLPESYGLHVPPGAPAWRLPGPEMKMVFIDLSPAQLCAVIKNPGTTGGKDLHAMMVHIRDDKLVAWGWNPGLGRNPVPVPRERFVAAFQEWMSLGAPCPNS